MSWKTTITSSLEEGGFRKGSLLVVNWTLGVGMIRRTRMIVGELGLGWSVCVAVLAVPAQCGQNRKRSDAVADNKVVNEEQRPCQQLLMLKTVGIIIKS